MKVILAGMNVDLESLQKYTEFISQLESGEGDADGGEGERQVLSRRAQSIFKEYHLTPESISAAYARISRDDRGVPELRRIAAREIRRARRSNQRIVFDMGHSSIAEHAVFNLDILDISRLVAEEVQHHRLISFTEKSQRYIRLEKGWQVPQEVTDAGWGDRWDECCLKLFEFYKKLVGTMEDSDKGPLRALETDGKNVAIEKPREDARYILPLATHTQMGVTVNARNLELLVRRLAASHLAESRQLSKVLLETVVPHAPSLIRYVQPTPIEQMMGCPKSHRSSGGSEPAPLDTRIHVEPDVRLLQSTERPDDWITGLLCFSSGSGDLVLNQQPRNRSETIRSILARIGPHESVPRAFEFVRYLFEARISASCYAQLKRHRMLSLICQEYDPALGVVVPPTIQASGLDAPFLEGIALAERFYGELEGLSEGLGSYALTNAHRRRVVIGINLRELYHFSRLRQDKHAQWEIRRLADEMVAAAKRSGALATALLAGKHDFADKVRDVFDAW